MSVIFFRMKSTAFRRVAGLATCLCFSLIFLSVSAQAQNHPFAVGGNEGVGAPTNGLLGWIVAQQNAFHHALTLAVRDVKSGAGGFWALAALCFGYGVFHAAGPGHGKAIIASYLVANERALGRGLALTFFAALFQGVVAIAMVGVAALLFRATAQTMNGVALWIEDASYFIIVVLGLWLTVKKGRAFLALLRPGPVTEDFATQRAAERSFRKPKGQSAIAERSSFVCEAIGADHIHSKSCGHVHAPDPATLGKNFAWGPALTTAITAGARPCSGAILVLVFCLAQNIFLVGIGATLAMSLGVALTTGALAAFAVFAKDSALRLSGEGARGALIGRVLEFVAALTVLALGAILLLSALHNRGFGPV